VNVVERQDVEEVVGGRVVPCFAERLCLGHEGGLCEENSFLLLVRSFYVRVDQ
jgi:hypothetical protein